MKNILRRKIPSPPKSPSRYPSPPVPTVADSAVEEIIISAENTLASRVYSNCTDSCIASTSLFSNSTTKDRRNCCFEPEAARHFLSAVYDLQSAMKSLVSNTPKSPLLSRSQGLVQAAMKRLESEFHLILTSDRLRKIVPPPTSISSTPPSFSKDNIVVFEIGTLLDKQPSVRVESDGDLNDYWKAMEDLTSIADCMISCGYSVECVKTFKKARLSMIEEIMAGLDFSPGQRSMSQFHKLTWDELETKTKNWLFVFDFAMTEIFPGERILCDHVLSSLPSIQDLYFSEVTGEIALSLLQFPYSVATKSKKSLEKVFRFLDLYDSIARNSPAINSVFSSDSTSGIRKKAESSLLKLREAVRSCFVEFESAICKDSSKLIVSGGGVHPLTRYVMNYLSLISDHYSHLLNDILSGWRFNIPASLPSEYKHLQSKQSPVNLDQDTQRQSDVSDRFAWLILVLLCKLDSKAELYKDVSLSYLFLANNLSYIVDKVSSSSELHRLVGEEWVWSHGEKALQYAWSFERVGWSEVIACLDKWPMSEVSLEKVKRRFRRFNSEFLWAHEKQVGLIAVDHRVRDEVRSSLRRKIVPKYRDVYQMYRSQLGRRGGDEEESVVKFAPEDLEKDISTLLSGTVSASNSVSSLSSEPFSSSGGRSHEIVSSDMSK